MEAKNSCTCELISHEPTSNGRTKLEWIMVIQFYRDRFIEINRETKKTISSTSYEQYFAPKTKTKKT